MKELRLELWYQWAIRRTWPDRFLFWLAFKLPRRLIYFALIRAWSNATTGEHGNVHPDDVKMTEAVDRWQQ